jgi:hypothetical protein
MTGTAVLDCVADILEREIDSTIHEWMTLVEKDSDLTKIKLNYEQRTGHLPSLLHEVIARLRLDKTAKPPVSANASHHGELRKKQGYSAAMVVDESDSCRSPFFQRCTEMSILWTSASCFRTS